MKRFIVFILLILCNRGSLSAQLRFIITNSSASAEIFFGESSTVLSNKFLQDKSQVLISDPNDAGQLYMIKTHTYLSNHYFECTLSMADQLFYEIRFVLDGPEHKVRQVYQDFIKGYTNTYSYKMIDPHKQSMPCPDGSSHRLRGFDLSYKNISIRCVMYPCLKNYRFELIFMDWNSFSTEFKDG